ncbi:MAG: hypothetical protein AAF802_32235, partial [Planctomycetota bacterium]
LDEVLGQSSSLRQTHANVTGSGPVSSSLRRGPAGSRTWVAMYSTPAVECVRLLAVMQFGNQNAIDEVVTRGFTVLYH